MCQFSVSSVSSSFVASVFDHCEGAASGSENCKGNRHVQHKSTEGREGLEPTLIISLCLGMMLSSVMSACFLLDRYPYYALSVINYEVKQLTWLRYTAWIPLYPIGFTCEGQL